MNSRSNGGRPPLACYYRLNISQWRQERTEAANFGWQRWTRSPFTDDTDIAGFALHSHINEILHISKFTNTEAEARNTVFAFSTKFSEYFSLVVLQIRGCWAFQSHKPINCDDLASTSKLIVLGNFMEQFSRTFTLLIKLDYGFPLLYGGVQLKCCYILH